jgi:hypothetical protein
LTNVIKPGEHTAKNITTSAIQESDGALIDTLPMTHQIIIRAKGSYAKISADLGVPIGTVRSRLHRARIQLKKLRTKGG